MNQTRNVLFICTQNSARSQMAEAILRARAGDRFEVHSAGLNPSAIHPLTVRVMEEAGYDLSGHEAKSVKQYLGRKHFNYVISVCDQAAPSCPRFFPNALNILNWSLQDPASVEGSDEEVLEAFREVRTSIEQRVDEWLAGLPN